MKINRVIWGVIFLFIGTIMLLQNLNIITFYWRNILSFWPLFLVVAGINMLFNRNGRQTGSYISLTIVIVTLGFLFYRGQQPPLRSTFYSFFDDSRHNDEDFDWEYDESDTSNKKAMLYSEGFIAADTAKKTVLNIAGGGVSFDLKHSTDSLFEADVKKRRANFSLTKISTDSSTTLSFDVNKSTKRGRNGWSMNSAGSEVAFRLNPLVQWEMNLKMGASEVDFDLSPYKIRNFTFEGGASDVELKFGDRLPISDVKIKTGAANIEIKIPQTVGCRIKTKSGLTSSDFKGFSKMADGSYETANFKASGKKLFIDLEGGLSSFEVDRY